MHHTLRMSADNEARALTLSIAKNELLLNALTSQGVTGYVIEDLQSKLDREIALLPQNHSALMSLAAARLYVVDRAKRESELANSLLERFSRELAAFAPRLAEYARACAATDGFSIPHESTQPNFLTSKNEYPLCHGLCAGILANDANATLRVLTEVIYAIREDIIHLNLSPAPSLDWESG